MWLARAGAAVAALVAGSCGGADLSSPDAAADAGTDAVACTADDLRPGAQIYYGTTMPSYAPLTLGQIDAIGGWTANGPGDIFCSGTLVAPSWVLTAAHCDVAVGNTFCIGPDAAGGTCLRAVEVQTHPVVDIAGTPTTLDLTMVRLAADASTVVPGIEPIPIIADALTPAMIGETGETAGFGDTETGITGHRLFAAEQIWQLTGEQISVDGMGMHGVCFGDSGGPVLVIDGAATVRVAGALSGGESSCVGHDNFARVDIARAWIELFTGPTPTPDNHCGTIDAMGRCSGSHALWCEGDLLQNAACAPGACGWDAGAAGFRCITGGDPCGGVDRIGACSGGTARWCDGGTPHARDCGCRGEKCTFDPSQGGAYCLPDPCMGLDYLGRCDGNVAEWCDGALQSKDCAALGQVCAYIDATIGYYCRAP